MRQENPNPFWQRPLDIPEDHPWKKPTTPEIPVGPRLTRNQLIEKIIGQVDERMINLGLGRKPELGLHDILVPQVEVASGRSSRALEETGLKDFPIIFVKTPGTQTRNNVIYLSAGVMRTEVLGAQESSSGFYYGRRYRGSTVLATRQDCRVQLTSELFGPNRRAAIIILPGEPGREPTLPKISKEETMREHSFLQMQEGKIPLGIIYDRIRGDHQAVLLLVDNGRGVIEASSLTLPVGWRLVVRGGKLVEKTAQEPERTQLLTPEMQILSDRMQSAPAAAFREIQEKALQFPQYDTGGFIVGKDESRRASFGQEGTNVEIELGDNKITFTFYGLDEKKLLQHCPSEYGKRGTLSLHTFAACFSKDARRNFPDCLVVEACLDKDHELNIKAKIARWDVLSRTFEDSLPHLSYEIRQSSQLKEILGDPNLILSYSLSLLRMPPIITPDESGETGGRRPRWSDDWEDDRGDCRQDQSGLSFSHGSYGGYSPPPVAVAEDLEPKTIVVPVGSRQDTPEAKARYRANKSLKSKSKRVEAKHKAKKKKGKR